MTESICRKYVPERYINKLADNINKLTDDQIKEILSVKDLSFKVIIDTYSAYRFMPSIYIIGGFLHFNFGDVYISIDEFKSIIREKKINCILE